MVVTVPQSYQLEMDIEYRSIWIFSRLSGHCYWFALLICTNDTCIKFTVWSKTWYLSGSCCMLSIILVIPYYSGSWWYSDYGWSVAWVGRRFVDCTNRCCRTKLYNYSSLTTCRGKSSRYFLSFFFKVYSMSIFVFISSILIPQEYMAQTVAIL